MHARTRVRFRTFFNSYRGRTPILCVLLLFLHLHARTPTQTHTDNEHELTSLLQNFSLSPPIVAFWPDAGGANSFNTRKFVPSFLRFLFAKTSILHIIHIHSNMHEHSLPDRHDVEILTPHT